MNVLVFNASPKGRNSITVQTARYLAAVFADDTFDFVEIATSWNAAEQRLAEIREKLARADAVVFAYPIYSFFAPSQLIEALSTMKAAQLPFAGKAFTQITSSMKVLDPLAHEWLAKNARDLGLRVIPGVSASQYDLPTEKGRAEACAFWRYFRAAASGALDAPTPVRDGDRFDTVILTDLTPDDGALAALIGRFRTVYPYRTRVCNVRDLGLRGGCLGCMRCMPEGHCVYTDGFEARYREGHASVDATVMAFSVVHHGLGPELKRFFDRTYFSGHRPPAKRSSVAYLVNGDLADEPQLRQLLNGYTQFRHTRDCGIVTAADGEPGLRALAARLQYSMENDFLLPRNFYGEACMTMFRDIVTELRGVMRADYRYFRDHGLLDFAQDRADRIRMSMQAGMLLSSPELERDLGMTFLEAMVKDHQTTVEQARQGGNDSRSRC